MFYLDLFSALERRQVRYVLVGGLAMNLHGVPRTTMDVDIVIALDVKNKDAFLAASRDLKLRPVAPVTIEDLFDPQKRREWVTQKNMIVFALCPADIQGPTVDVLIDSPIDFDDALKRSVHRDVGGVKVILAATEDLIRLKENTGRAQDIADIDHLRRIAQKPL